MTLKRWQTSNQQWPLQQLSTLQDELSRLMQSPWTRLEPESGTQPFMGGWSPAVDVHEDGDNLYVRAELPGMKKDQIELSLHEQVLTLAGERKLGREIKEPELYRSERFVGKFHRTLGLPTPVDAEKIKASYTDGILSVVLPKAEAAKPRQIQVKAN